MGYRGSLRYIRYFVITMIALHFACSRNLAKCTSKRARVDTREHRASLVFSWMAAPFQTRSKVHCERSRERSGKGAIRKTMSCVHTTSNGCADSAVVENRPPFLVLKRVSVRLPGHPKKFFCVFFFVVLACNPFCVTSVTEMT